MKLILITMFLVCVSVLTTESKEGNRGLLVMFDEKLSISEVQSRDIFQQNSDIHFTEYFEHLGVWYLTYEINERTEKATIEMLRDDPAVLNVNPVRDKVSLRSSLPNDNELPSQWSLHNTGQSGGISGADIDAINAWKITRGDSWGGHIPIISVVDDGFQQNHNDLGFLPGGYNAYNNSYSLPVNDHGTHVSGILGAKANNSIGIAGINWDTNIFPVAGSSGNEVVVLRAYNHILDLRKQYNSSGGASGQFIVAVNNSFGVDGGNPANYSSWCAAYDSLGVHGIISVAATANSGWDVDLVGDIPTACPSNYLISVTNTNHNDVKHANAAWGATSIDLGAPGTSILSTMANPSNSYASMTGTSMATPHVTGVVGLIYSILPYSIISNSLNDPSALPMQIKNGILNSVDPNASLNGITTTGGRLNAYNALKYTIAHHGAHLGKGMSQVKLPLWSNLTMHEDITLEDGSSLEIEVQSGTVNIDVSSVTVTIGGSAPTSRIAGGRDQDMIADREHEGDIESDKPRHFKLAANYPNPFNPSTVINYQLPESSEVSLVVYDIMGRSVATLVNSTMPAGSHTAQFDASHLASGVYLYRIRAGDFVQTRQMLLVK